MRLHAALREHPDELEADLWDIGINLTDLWRDERPDVTFRRLKVLVSQLRPGSRLAQATMADDAWTTEDYLLAAIMDQVRINTWAVINRGASKSKQSKQPEPIDRPKDMRAERDRQREQLKKARAFKAHLSQ